MQVRHQQFLTANNNEVDAVVASNDGTAGGAIAALAAQGLAGSVPVSGQDGDHAALNRIALGTQTVSVWKDARELGKKAAEVALELAAGTALDAVTGVVPFAGGPKGVKMNAFFIAPAVRGVSWKTLTSTHPSLEQRLEQLAKVAAELGRPLDGGFPTDSAR